MSYILLPKQPATRPPIKVMGLEEFWADDELKDTLTGPLGLDFETNTYDYTAPDFKVRTVGLGNDDIAVSVDLLGASQETVSKFGTWLLEQPYVAHNLAMEAGTLQSWLGNVGKPICDTYVVLADLASEERGPRDLGTAMVNLLDQEKDSDAIKSYMQANKLIWEDVDQFDIDILGKYNAIDAWGCWALYKYFQTITDSYNDTWGQHYWQYHQEDCQTEVLLQVEAKIGGIHVEEAALLEEYDTSTANRDAALTSFLEHELVKPHIKEYQKAAVAELEGNPPPQFTKAGKETARYSKWVEKVATMKDELQFNTNSTAQLRWLFFDRMGLTPVEFTDKGEPSTAADCLAKMGDTGQLLLKYRGLVTRLKFLTQVKEGTRDGIIRPSVRPFVTLTTRCGAGKLE